MGVQAFIQVRAHLPSWSALVSQDLQRVSVSAVAFTQRNSPGKHAYALSLARFASKLGPVGWGVAAKRIREVIGPNVDFGRGWVGKREQPMEIEGLTEVDDAELPLP